MNLNHAEPVFQPGISIDRPAVVKPSAMAVAMAMPIVSTQKSNANVSADPSAAKVWILRLILNGIAFENFECSRCLPTSP